MKAAGITPEQVAKATFMRGKGCNHCHQCGYRGRLGIFEMMKLNSNIREMTFNREPTQTIRKVARKTGMRTLLEDGIQKSLKGITTLEEVLSICHHEATHDDCKRRSRTAESSLDEFFGDDSAQSRLARCDSWHTFRAGLRIADRLPVSTEIQIRLSEI